jgi:hypothetical protein
MDAEDGNATMPDGVLNRASPLDFRAMSFPHRALQPAMITSGSQEVHSGHLRRCRELGVVPASGNAAGYKKQGE